MADQATETADGSFLGRLRALGPALVLAAVVVGPGSIALSTIAGSTSMNPLSVLCNWAIILGMSRRYGKLSCTYSSFDEE